jgi:DNA-binding CsgD family transcriptional regulator
LLLAANLPDLDVPPRVRLDAVAAALAVGRYHAAVRTLDGVTILETPELRAEHGILRAEALLQAGDPAGALAVTFEDTAGLPVELLAELDRVRILGAVSSGDKLATAEATTAARSHFGDATGQPAPVAAALAIASAINRDPEWSSALASAAQSCEAAGRTSDERWCRWVLAETLAADGDTAEAGSAAEAGAARCAADGAYSWESRFVALGLWVCALRGERLDEVVRRATDLLDRSLPGRARAYALAAGCLAAADSGALGLARGRISGGLPDGMVVSGIPAEALAWVGQEVAWLDGVVDGPTESAIRQSALLLGLAEITEHWTAYERAAGAIGAHAEDTGRIAAALQPPAEAAAATLRAWNRAAGGWPSSSEFNEAASAWHQRVVREEIRALLGVVVAPDPPDAAVPALLAAEAAAEAAGLVVLLGRVRKALRRYVAHGRVSQRNLDERPRLGPSSSPLSARETEVLKLVAAGESTRRIATRLGLSRETVETHVRSGMRKLGARTRTEAAALVAAELGVDQR